jgi:hypothetical protein
MTSGRDVGVAVAAFILVALSGCQQILGLHERSGAAPGDGGSDAGVVFKPVAGVCGSLRHPSAACAACMDTKCCDEAMACRNDPACDPAFDCTTNCGDDATCRARCNTFFTRADTFVNVSVCRESNCEAECGLSCGGFGYNAPGCESCVKQTCCPSAGACAKNGDCIKLDLCRSNCLAGSLTCPTECEQTYAGGVGDLVPWFDCVQNTCAEACAPGRNWQCLDTRTPWLKPKSAGSITFSITIVDILGEQPFVGATAKACDKRDLLCATPFDTKSTDARGFVELTVPAGTGGFDGYVDLTGGNNGGGTTESEIFPAIWYPVPNIVSSGWRGRIQFVSRASFTGLALLTSATIDKDRGHFAAAAQDCNFSAAGSVTFDADTKDDLTTVFYFVMGSPKTNATQTDPQSGIGGYINLPANGLTLVTAYVPVGDMIKTIGALTFIIRPGTFTTTSIPPIPQ